MGVDPFSWIIFAASTAYQIKKANDMKKKQQEAATRAAEEADKRKGFFFTRQDGDSTSIPVVYGKQIIGGIQSKTLVKSNFNAASENQDRTFSFGLLNNSQTGSKNEFLNTQYVLCHEGIQGVEWVKVDGKHFNEPTAKFQHRIRVFNNGGTACNASTANGVQATNTFTKAAFATATFKLNRDEQNYAGEPSVQFFVKGRKVRDINRSGTFGNYTYTISTLYAYSNNPPLVLLDYLLNKDFGRGLDPADIDLESFYNAARICEQVVTTGRSIGGRINNIPAIRKYPNRTLFPQYLIEGEDAFIYYDEANDQWYDAARASGDGEQLATYTLRGMPGTRDLSLYEANLTLDTQVGFRDNIEIIMNTMELAELIWSGEGKYKLIVDYPKSEAETEALVNSEHVFTEEDIIRESLSITFPSAVDRVNQMTVTFNNEHEDFRTDSITWPTFGSNVYNQYLTEDNNQPFKASMNGVGITNPYHALAAAERAVRKSRTMFIANFTLTKKGLTIEPGDLIKVLLPDFKINGQDFNQVMRVDSIKVNQDFTVQVSAYRFGHDVLAWNVDDDIAYAIPNVSNFTVDNVTNLQYAATANGDRENTLGLVSWDYDGPSGYKYDVFYKRSTNSDYLYLGTTGAKYFDIFHLENIQQDENFDFLVKAVSPYGNKSSGVEIKNQLVSVAPPAVTALNVLEEQYLTNNASGVKNRVRVSWEAGSPGIKTTYYKVEYKQNSDTVYQSLGTIAATNVTIPDLSDGIYQFKITPYSFLDFPGPEAIFDKDIVGFSAAPADPQGFAGNINEGQINLTWNPPTDLDVLYGGHSEIRFHSALDGSATWDTASVLVQKLSGNTTNKTVPTLKGTFFLRFFDAFGNFSANPASFVSTFEDKSFNAIDIIDEDSTGFPGTKINCSVSLGVLNLTVGQSQMEYFFNNVVDLREVTTVRLVPNLTVSVTVAGTTVASYTNISLVNNFAGPIATAAIQMFVSTTQDDPNGASPVWTDYKLLTIGSYTARGLRFKFVATAQDSNTAISVSRLEVTLDKKDIIKTGKATSSTAGDTLVTFAEPYYTGVTGTATPTVGIMVIGGQIGDNIVISNRNENGFSFSVYNNGSRVVRNVDYQAIGQ
ncbi:phage tail protein [bacterium]|nr:phage tail protein [bacterium]